MLIVRVDVIRQSDWTKKLYSQSRRKKLQSEVEVKKYSQNGLRS